MRRVFGVGRKCLYHRFQMIMNEFRNAFSWVNIASDDWTTRATLLVNFWEEIKTASPRIWVGSYVFEGTVINTIIQ